MTAEELEGLTADCQRRNGQCNVSGLLLYSDGHFMQLLEGPQTTVADVFARISTDARHHNIQQLHFAACQARLFPGWEMGLLNLDATRGLDRARLQKVIDSMKSGPNGRKVLTLLRDFRDQLPADPADTPQKASA